MVLDGGVSVKQVLYAQQVLAQRELPLHLVGIIGSEGVFATGQLPRIVVDAYLLEKEEEEEEEEEELLPPQLAIYEGSAKVSDQRFSNGE